MIIQFTKDESVADDDLILNEPDATFVVVRNPGFIVAAECDTKIYEVGVHADVVTLTNPPASSALPIIGAVPGVIGKYNCFVVTLDVVKEFITRMDVLSEFVCTRGVTSLDVAVIVAPSTVGAVTLVVPASTDAVIVPAADNEDVKIELVRTTGVVILDLEYIVDAITSSNVTTDPRVYTGEPN